MSKEIFTVTNKKTKSVRVLNDFNGLISFMGDSFYRNDPNIEFIDFYNRFKVQKEVGDIVEDFPYTKYITQYVKLTSHDSSSDCSFDFSFDDTFDD